MTDFANLKVTMFFDPAQVWQHTSQFEKSFASYLETIGMQAQTVKTIGGSSGEVFFLISKKPMIDIPQQNDKPTKSPQQKLKEMATKPEPKKK